MKIMERDFINPDMKKKEKGPKALRDQFGETIAALGETYKELVVFDADLSSSTRTALFAKKFPERFTNMGIAELNMVGVAMGFAVSGFIPIVSGFACFTLGRAWEFIKNAAYDSLPLLLCPSHAGLSAARDGGSHQMLEDIALLNTIPNTEIYCPSDPVEVDILLREIIPSLYDNPRVVYVRLMRSPLPYVFKNEQKLVTSFNNKKKLDLKSLEPILIFKKDYGVEKGGVNKIEKDVVSEMKNRTEEGIDKTNSPQMFHITIFSTGSMTAFIPKIVERLGNSINEKDNDFNLIIHNSGFALTSIEVYHFPQVKPIDENYLLQISKQPGIIITLEEHNTRSGFGAEIARIISDKIPKRILNIGIEDRFGQTGSLDELYREYELDPASISSKIIKFMKMS